MPMSVRSSPLRYALTWKLWACYWLSVKGSLCLAPLQPPDINGGGGNGSWTETFGFALAFPPMPAVWGVRKWQRALLFFCMLTCVFVSLLVVLLALTCFIFAVRLALVIWKHSNEPVEAPAPPPQPSSTAAWDLWHGDAMSDALEGEVRAEHPASTGPSFQ